MNGVRTDILQYQNLDRASEIDQRIVSRFVPEVPLPVNFSARPVLTKYAVFPMIDNRMPATEPIQPTTGRQCGGGVAEYLRNIDAETDLLRPMPLDVYVPSSRSDLYRVAAPGGMGTGENTIHTLLSRQFTFDTATLDEPTRAQFHNSTRVREEQ